MQQAKPSVVAPNKLEFSFDDDVLLDTEEEQLKTYQFIEPTSLERASPSVVPKKKCGTATGGDQIFSKIAQLIVKSSEIIPTLIIRAY